MTDEAIRIVNAREHNLKSLRRGVRGEGAGRVNTADAKPVSAWPNRRGGGTSAADRRVLTAAILADPEAVATVVLALTTLEQAGNFGGERWAPVRAGIVSLADLIRAREA